MLYWVWPALAQPASPAFAVVPPGVKGGLAEDNLSAYLVAAAGSTDYICLDMGSLRPGIEKAVASYVFTTSVHDVLRKNTKSYCLSHPHLDHVAGLLLNAPAGTGPGNGPRKHATQRAFPLSHGAGMQSTAFLVRSGAGYLLYLGDTGADEVEKSHCLRDLWLALAPLVQARQLKAIFMETSYPNAQPPARLFGHLTPALLLRELGWGAGPAALRGLPVVIPHLKRSPGSEALHQNPASGRQCAGAAAGFFGAGQASSFQRDPDRAWPPATACQWPRLSSSHWRNELAAAR